MRGGRKMVLEDLADHQSADHSDSEPDMQQDPPTHHASHTHAHAPGAMPARCQSVPTPGGPASSVAGLPLQALSARGERGGAGPGGGGQDGAGPGGPGLSGAAGSLRCPAEGRVGGGGGLIFADEQEGGGGTGGASDEAARSRGRPYGGCSSSAPPPPTPLYFEGQVGASQQHQQQPDSPSSGLRFVGVGISLSRSSSGQLQQQQAVAGAGGSGAPPGPLRALWLRFDRRYMQPLFLREPFLGGSGGEAELAWQGPGTSSSRRRLSG